MARSSWNRNSPDVVGVEFLGVGVASNIIQTDTQMTALRFKPQRSGQVDEIAIYSGTGTNNPVLTAPHWSGRRKPWIIELIPASGFDAGGFHTTHFFQSAITASSNVVDEVGTAPEGNELAVQNDGLFLFNDGGTPSQVTVHILGANTFPLNLHVYSIAIEASSLKQMNVRRIDQNGGFLWTKLFAAGYTNWHMGEAYIENGTPGTPYQLWTPQNVREFNSAVGNRRLRYNALNTQSNIMDLLTIHVDTIPERRAGVGIIEPPGNHQWVMSTPFHAPNVTGTPATVLQGQEYIVLVRTPGGEGDYGSSATFDWRGLGDLRTGGGSFTHFTDLDWDTRAVNLYEATVPQSLGDVIDGLPALRIINDNAQTVDTQPYQFVIGLSPRPVSDTTYPRPRQALSVPAGTTEYRQVRAVVSLFEAVGAPADKKSVLVDIVNDADAVLAGPFEITQAVWEASPEAGNNIFGDPFRVVTLDFGAGIDINEAGGVNARFTLHPDYTGNITWRIACAVADIPPITGSDQTAVISATGYGFIPPTNQFLPVHNNSDRRGDILVSLLSQAPEITGIGVTGMAQAVTGGACDPCSTAPTDCTVRQIPFHRVCWPKTTLTQDKFGYYELQRQESAVSPDWVTIAVITPTGTPVSGVPATGVPSCYDDYSHVFDTPVCYQVRQQRTDGSLSDFVDMACITTPAPTGADLVITAPEDPSLNVAFPEAYGSSLPIEQTWTNLDADQTILRAVYGRDNHLAFRPSERLGLQFQRRLIVSALCTPVKPCLDVVDGIRNITAAPVEYLVVRDNCGNRWYASVVAPTILRISDPDLGDIWLVDIKVTELATPVITP